jgi:serine/threonine protein kinase/Tol biopolymer transport system component
MALTPGARIGPYEVVAPIGAGGMGEVYRARDPRFGRDVALKVLPAHAGSDTERLRRFEQEARAAGVLNHPNILTVHDVGSADGHPYLVCELLEGETLRERLGAGPLPAARAIEVALQVAHGLAAAHAKGVVHRDLKPENLFLTRDGRVKILDFGIAKLLAREAGASDALATAPGTALGVVMGTAAYMSPEQVSGQVVDERSDLFSFGIVLHEMLSGKTPFAERTPIETMTAVLRADPPPLGVGENGVTPALDRVVTHCLEKSPDARFQSARDLAFALEALAGSSASPTPVSDSPRDSPTRRDSPATRASGLRLPWWAALALAACAFGAAWLAFAGRGQGRTLQFSRVVKLVATDAIESSPVLSPDGKWLAYLSDQGGRMNVWVRFLSGGQPVSLTAAFPELHVLAVREIGGLDISPDGSEIVFQGGTDPGKLANEQTSFVIPAPLGGTPRKLIGRGLNVRWSPDGRRIAYVLPGGAAGDALAIADRTGENERTVLPVAGGLHAHWLAWSPDGRYLYFNRGVTSANLEPSEVHRVPVDGGPEESVIATSRRASFPSPLAGGLVYSANPSSVDLALWWKPWNGDPVRITTGIGEYAEARLSADGRRMVATVYQPRRALWTMPIDDAARAPVLLSEAATGDSDPAWSPKGDRLAFSSTRSGDRNIWTAKVDGSDARQITTGEAIDDRPQWSPDGSRIAFVSSRGGERGVWTVDADGGTPRRVVAAKVLNALTWSPDGREILFSTPDGDAPALFRVGIDGGTPTRIPTPTAASSPAWSPVNDVIAYVATVRAAGSAPGRTWPAFTRPSGEQIAAPEKPTLANGTVTWSVDGRWLAGISSPGTGPSSIWVFPAGGQAPPRQLIEFGPEARPWGLAWSPDGKTIVFGLQERTADIVLFDN